MFCCVVYDFGQEKQKAYIQHAHDLMKSFNHFNPGVPSVLYAFGLNQNQIDKIAADNINIVSDPIFANYTQMFIYRSQLVVDMIDEWKWCILMDTDTLVRKPLDDLIKLVDCPEPIMAAFKRPVANQGWNCGVMAMNNGAKKALERWHHLQQEHYKKLKKQNKTYPLCYEQTAWELAANDLNLSLTNYGRKFNSMADQANRGGNGTFGDNDAIWHSKGGHKGKVWIKETKRIMGLCNATK